LVRHAVDVALGAAVEPVIVVVGSHGERVAGALSGAPVTVIDSPHWERGQGASMASAVAALPDGVQAAVFLLADQPNVTSGLIDRCVESWRQSGAPAVVCHDGAAASPPAVFDRSLFLELGELGELNRLAADQGGRSVVRRHLPHVRYVDVSSWETADIDTPVDYLRLVLRLVGRCAVGRLAALAGAERIW